MKKLTVGLSALFLTFSAPAVWSETITVGVAANFCTPLSEIIDLYTTENPGQSVNIACKATGTLNSEIIAGGTSNGPYDVFLAANQATPAALKTSYPTFVEGNTFTYATGYPVAWSNSLGVTLSAGIPFGFNSAPLNYGKVAIANPSTAPYGAAAWSILQGSPTFLSGYPNANVQEYVDIGATFAAVFNYPTSPSTGSRIGIVAKSAVCKRTAGVESFSGEAHYVYTSNPIIQDGIVIERSVRTIAEDSLVTDFVSYLRASGGGAASIIDKYCY